MCFRTHVYTDHLPLVSIFAKQTKDITMNRWALLVQEFDVTIKYVPGKENILADALSRLPLEEEVKEDFYKKLGEKINLVDEELNSYLPQKTPWNELELKTAQGKDEECIKIKKLIKNPRKASDKIIKFKIIKGILFTHRTLKRSNGSDEILVPYIPNELMDRAFQMIHAETTAGHQGFEGTLKLFRKKFYNIDESKLIKEKCENCAACIKAKGHPNMVPIRKYPIPYKPFNTISTDILGPLPITSNNNKFILVVRDYTTRYSIIVPLKNKETNSVIKAFRYIIGNYGSSEICISDNGREFTSEKFKNFLKFYNTKKVEIAPFHPSSQGLAERINKEINKLLRIYTNELKITNWDELIPTIMLTINNTYNSSIKETPFYALYGYDSPTISFVKAKLNYNEDDLNYHLKRVSEIREHCRNTLLKAQDKYTSYKNENRKEKDINIGDRVFARLSKHIPHKKLNYPISGPFIVADFKGNALILKSINSDESYTVHPDEVINKPGPQQLNEEEKKDKNEEDKKTKNERKYNLRPKEK